MAFCCISTGVFNFINEEEANITIKTIIASLEKNKKLNMKNILCVYKDIDEIIYNSILKQKMKNIIITD